MIYHHSQVISQESVGNNIYLLTISAPTEECRAGQFYMLKVNDLSLTLMRPISIFQIQENSISFLYRVNGKGTEILSNLKALDTIYILGPLGTGFPCDEVHGHIALVGGGIGVAPLWQTAHELIQHPENQVDIFLGYKDDLFVLDKFKELNVPIKIACEKEKSGFFVTDLFNPAPYDAVFTCGPEPMMHIIHLKCKETNTPLWVSEERRMACGVGACLGCSIQTRNGMKRVCKEGPVFPAEELTWNK